ncbi:MAG: hypothetical protein K8S98_00045 [Planctomycetes bacterium]|nr:hypothetical protein [Planctomycetota bacterium]
MRCATEQSVGASFSLSLAGLAWRRRRCRPRT